MIRLGNVIDLRRDPPHSGAMDATAETAVENSTDTAAASPETLRGRVRAWLESTFFERFIITIIVINAIGLGLETSPEVMARIGPFIEQMDRIAIAIFVVEIALKLFAYGFGFFRNGW
ncbi:MAG: ion transporter, partial [Pseudomonadota bacterium]